MSENVKPERDYSKPVSEEQEALLQSIVGHVALATNLHYPVEGARMRRLVAEFVDRLSRPAPALPEDSRVIARLNDWCVTYGKSLCPPGADTFGEGMREAKKQVARILASASECRHENIELPEPQDEQGRRAQFPAIVRCPECGERVEVR